MAIETIDQKKLDWAAKFPVLACLFISVGLNIGLMYLYVNCQEKRVAEQKEALAAQKEQNKILEKAVKYYRENFTMSGFMLEKSNRIKEPEE